MRGKKLLVIVGLLLALLIVPVFSILRVIDVSKFPLISTPASFAGLAADSTPMVFVDPVYTTDEALQSGNYFTVYVNISDVTDLFTWNINITWNPAILNFGRVKEYGSFLRATTSPNGTSGWIDRDPTKNVTIASFNNTAGYAAVAETILDSRPDAVGVSGSGRLVAVEFLVTGYGSTDLNISLTGNLATKLLNSTGGMITLTKTDGYFRNVIPGDMTDDSPGVLPDLPDGDVDGFDFGAFADAFGTSVGQPNYNILADLTDDSPGVPPDLPDGHVDGFDFGVFADNFGRSISLP